MRPGPGRELKRHYGAGKRTEEDDREQTRACDIFERGSPQQHPDRKTTDRQHAQHGGVAPPMR